MKNPLTFKNARDLGQFLIAEITKRNRTVVSFDVFDTLIHRRLAPEAITRAVAFWLSEQLIDQGFSIIVNVLEARHKVYSQLIHEKAARGLDLDVSLDELVLPWVRECVGKPFMGDTQLSEQLASIELDYEISSCFCNADFLALTTELKNRGIRLIYTSDMYLGAKYINEILSACGYKNLFDAQYVSGDLALLKRTGRIFEAVLTSENIPSSDLIHVGDNEFSDGIKPAEHGILALVHLERDLIKRNRRMQYDHERAKSDRSWLGVLAAQFTEAGLDEVGTVEEAYGRRILGPILAPFIHRIVERCKQENIQHIYFMAREGYILKTLFDDLAPAIFDSKNAPKSYYLCVSRLTTFLASMKGFSLREISASLNNTPYYSIQTLFAPLKIESETLSRIALKHGIVDINAPLPEFFLQWSPLSQLIQDTEITAIISRKSSTMRAHLSQYLEQIGFFDVHRVAVVDIGWSGQIQANLYNAISDLPECPQIFGFYLGTTLAAHWRKTPNNWMEWSHTDQCHLGWSGKSALEFVQGLEAAVRAPHGTVIDYQIVSDYIHPVFKSNSDTSRQAEMRDDTLLALMQHGIQVYGGLYSKVVQMFNITSHDTLPYARTMLNRMVRFPTPREARFFLNANNVSDLGSSEVLVLGAGGSPSLWHFRKFKRILRQSFWRYGTVALTRSTIIQWIFVVSAATRAIAKKWQSLDPGIVFSNYTPPPPEKSALSTSTDNNMLFEQISNDHAQLVLKGRKERRKNQLHGLTSPLTLGEMIAAYTAFKASSLACKLSGRHTPYQDGMSIRGWISRELAQHPKLKDLLVSIRKRLK